MYFVSIIVVSFFIVHLSVVVGFLWFMVVCELEFLKFSSLVCLWLLPVLPTVLVWRPSFRWLPPFVLRLFCSFQFTFLPVVVTA